MTTQDLCCALHVWILSVGLHNSVSASPSDQPVAIQVRPANAPLQLEATSLAEKIQRTSEKLLNRARKPEEIPGAASPLKTESAEAFQSLYRLQQIGDELILRGEAEGFRTNETANKLRASLYQALLAIRSHVGNRAGLVAAVDRRVKEQTNSLKQLDELIKQKQWIAAHKKLGELVEEADQVGLFVDPKYSEFLYAPIQVRREKIDAPYLAEINTKQVIPSLFKEYASLVPNLSKMRQRITHSIDKARTEKGAWWNDNPCTGPVCILLFLEDWRILHHKLVQALAILHVLGPPAQLELDSLAADYFATRSQAIALISQIIDAEVETVLDHEVYERYTKHLDMIPKFVSVTRCELKELSGLNNGLSRLAARSQKTANIVENYRMATSDFLLWKRRLAHQYLKSNRTGNPQFRSLGQLLDQAAEPNNDIATRRITQTSLTSQESFESVASAWSKQWRGVAVTAQDANVFWLPGADPVFNSNWHGRICLEITPNRAELNASVDAFSQELLAGPNTVPLTIEAVMAIHTYAHGPYHEVAGLISAATTDSLSHRLWHQDYPSDLNSLLSSSSLHTTPGFPVLVRLKLVPSWLAHDFAIWPAPTPDRNSRPRKPTAPGQSTGPDDQNSTRPKESPHSDPAKSKAPTGNTAGGVPF